MQGRNSNLPLLMNLSGSRVEHAVVPGKLRASIRILVELDSDTAGVGDPCLPTVVRAELLLRDFEASGSELRGDRGDEVGFQTEIAHRCMALSVDRRDHGGWGAGLKAVAFDSVGVATIAIPLASATAITSRMPPPAFPSRTCAGPNRTYNGSSPRRSPSGRRYEAFRPRAASPAR